MLRRKLKESLGDGYYEGMENVLKSTQRNVKLPAIAREDSTKFYLHQMYEALFAKREEVKSMLNLINRDLAAVQKLEHKLMELDIAARDAEDARKNLTETLKFKTTYEDHRA